jgi:hypothetical protein
MCRKDQKVHFAKGMTHTFTSDMPKRVESEVRYGIIGLTNRTYYFEYRNGSRLIPLPYRKTSATCFAKADGQTK